MTHPSALKGNAPKAFERLEFLGDRVLGLTIAHLLYVHFPEQAEGPLAKRLAQLCSKKQLVKIAQLWHVSDHLIAPGLQSGADNVLADAVESVLGAVYLDGGLDAVSTIVSRFWMNDLIHNTGTADGKSQLQMFCQAKGLPIPSYNLIGKKGSDHAPIFIVQVEGAGLEASAQAATKKEAEQLAAFNLLEQLERK